ncbi:MAG: sugar-binding transcriptional regulator [Chloroflexi bacterium]|nr:sugar-binding transcriptional regulator [Chloroflexota bacterium]
MSRVDELRLMTKVARLYHEQAMNQPEIATMLDISQATVSRLLKRAEQEKIIRIAITPPQGTYPELEETLRKTYDLKDVVVVDCENDDDDQLLRNIGAAAAFYVETTVKRGEVVGISSWSATLLAMVDSMYPLSRLSGVKIVQILGGVGNPTAEVHANHMTSRLTALFHGEAKFLPAPGVVGSASAHGVLADDKFVCETTELFDHVSMALVGIGALEPSKLLASSGNVFSKEELETLQAHGAVGDICLRFFDAHGKPVNTALDKRVIGMRLQQLQRAKRSVGIAGGRRKLTAIRGALEGRWINVLITDHFTAEKLVQS